MNGLLKAILLGFARDGAMAAGTYVTAHGLATAAQAQSLEGSIIFLVGFGFSLYDKFSVQKQVAVAAATVPPGYVAAPNPQQSQVGVSQK